MKLGSNVTQQIKQDAIKSFPNEMVGFVVNDEWVLLDNIHDKPIDHFKVSSQDYLRYSDGLQAIVHSHTLTETARNDQYGNGDPRAPSKTDQLSWKATGVPWGILYTEGENASDMIWLDDNERAPLIGRDFIFGQQDCWSIVRDWHYFEHGVSLMNIPREFGWDSGGENLYEENIENAGFEQFNGQDIQPGDVIFFKIQCDFYNHIGIYVGDNKMIHHLYGRLSTEENYSKWQSRASGWARAKYIKGLKT